MQDPATHHIELMDSTRIGYKTIISKMALYLKPFLVFFF